MAAPIPNDMGGGRLFAVDPAATNMSTMMGDQAAIILRLIHMLNPVIDDVNAVEVAAVVAAQRTILAASNISQGRERMTRELQPVTRLPAAGTFGININVANIRMHNVPTFSGGSKDTMDVIEWLSRVLNTAAINTLTFEAALHLLIQASTGGCSRYIEQMRREGKTLPQVVQQLEMRYGDLCSPEEARVKVNTLNRKEEEDLPEFIDRLRNMALMACRMTEDDDVRQGQIETLVEGNIRRVLPVSVRNALEERVTNRTRMGLPPFSARELEKECLDLEKRREERKTSLQDQGAVKRHGNVRRIAMVPPIIDSDIDSLPSSSDSDKEDGEDLAFHIIKEVKHYKNMYAQQGRRFDERKVTDKVIKNFNKYPPKQPRGHQPFGARQAAIGYTPHGDQAYRSGPPNRQEYPRKPIGELLDLANIERGCCLQCGQRGHMLKHDACALRDKPLTDRPCVKCGTGLHAADDCLKVYQKQYVHQPQREEQGQDRGQDLVKED